jgi:hypothetical protein
VVKIPNCERCRQSFIEEEFSEHECSPRTIGIQEIGIDRMYGVVTNENGDKVHIAKGLSGIMYRLVECHHNPPHSNSDPTTFDKEETRRRFYRTCFVELLPCRLILQIFLSVYFG